ncbi:hypothetical protein SAMN05661099_1095 [Daejeonella lutea]|uniref:Uncharacterized protein n=1 Tax=Daejeonella lutea TaxID=572036 RepID=A0A1T5AXQ8_9SPHI|nr:hypothetical protein SAMN05661099_1095 [Daejeonella lutea]
MCAGSSKCPKINVGAVFRRATRLNKFRGYVLRGEISLLNTGFVIPTEGRNLYILHCLLVGLPKGGTYTLAIASRLTEHLKTRKTRRWSYVYSHHI